MHCTGNAAMPAAVAADAGAEAEPPPSAAGLENRARCSAARRCTMGRGMGQPLLWPPPLAALPEPLLAALDNPKEPPLLRVPTWLCTVKMPAAASFCTSGGTAAAEPAACAWPLPPCGRWCGTKTAATPAAASSMAQRLGTALAADKSDDADAGPDSAAAAMRRADAYQPIRPHPIPVCPMRAARAAARAPSLKPLSCDSDADAPDAAAAAPAAAEDGGARAHSAAR